MAKKRETEQSEQDTGTSPGQYLEGSYLPCITWIMGKTRVVEGRGNTGEEGRLGVVLFTNNTEIFKKM